MFTLQTLIAEVEDARAQTHKTQEQRDAENVPGTTKEWACWLLEREALLGEQLLLVLHRSAISDDARSSLTLNKTCLLALSRALELDERFSGSDY